MANFSGKQNLMAYKGARLLTGIDQQHPQTVFVCIPVQWNDIELSQDGTRAQGSIYLEETSEKYRQKCIERKQMSGDDMTGYLPPSHTVEARFSKEFRERALEAAKKRIIGEHPEWQSNPDLGNPEFNRDLKNAMYDAVRIRLGSVYMQQRRTDTQQQPAYGGATAFGGQAQSWTPPQVDPVTGQPYGGQSAEDDDLPF